MAPRAKLKAEPVQAITPEEWHLAVSLIDTGKSDAAIAAAVGATRPHGARRVAVEQITAIRSEVTGG